MTLMFISISSQSWKASKEDETHHLFPEGFQVSSGDTKSEG